MTPQAARQLGGEQHRRLPGRQLAAAKSRHRTLTCAPADGGSVHQVFAAARMAVPVVALHLLVLRADHGTAQGMLRALAQADKAMRIAIDRETAMGRQTGSLALRDAGVDGQRRGLALARQVDGLFDRQLPRVIEVQRREFMGHARGIGQPVAGVFLRGAGDVAGRLHRVGNAGGTQVARRRVAFALAEIDGEAEVAVILEFQAVDLAPAHVDAVAAADREAGLGLRGAGGACALQRLLDQGFQFGGGG
jgi:hypothetical protein